MRFFLFLTTLVSFACLHLSAQEQDILGRVNHAYAENDGVKIHYVTLGEGEPIIMIHGLQ